MGPVRAKLAIGLASLNEKLSFGWVVEIPVAIKRIAQKGFQNDSVQYLLEGRHL